VRVAPDVLAAMEEMAAVAPAHNPPYVRAMRLLGERLPGVPLVAAFETGFHATIPPRNALYAVPTECVERHLVRRWGFHGASHRFVAGRLAELVPAGPKGLRAISCHLGGSSSVCWIRDGASVGTSMGMSPQSGLPQNNRAGDFDPFALLHVARQTGRSFEDLLGELSGQAGLAGMSGTSGDMRDLEEAAAAGTARAQNEARASGERAIHAASSRVAIWVIPTNEELIVARQARDLLAADREPEHEKGA
jgi:acetate kinase